MTGTLAPDSHLVQALRGISELERELSRAETWGYYEQLLDASPRAQASAGADPDAPQPPPSGYVPFGAAGIAEELPTYVRWRMKPNLDLVWNGVRFRTNRLGHRTPAFAPEKPEGVYRIVVYGSSNTMGHGVDDDAPFPRLLERWLNERFAPGRRVEVLNLAVSGDSPSRRLARLQADGNRFGADWIVCDATPLDPALEDHLRTIVRSSPPIPVPFAYVRDALRHAGVTASDADRAFGDKLVGQAGSLLAGAYSEWGKRPGGWASRSRSS